MKKIILSLILAGAMTLSLTACGGDKKSDAPAAESKTEQSGETSQAGSEVKKSDANVHVFWYTYSDTYIASVRSALNGLFDKASVQYQDYDANGNQTTQTEQVQTALSTGANVLLVNVVETGSDDAAQNIVDMAKEHDAAVVFFNREVSDDVVNSYEKCAFVGTDAAEAGHMQGEMIGKYLVENFDKVDLNGDGKISYMMLKGQDGNAEAEYRTQYSVEDADKLLKEAGKAPLEFYDPNNSNKYQVDQKGQWSAQAGQEYVTTALSEYNDGNKNMIELIIANNDGMAEGAISALETVGYNTGSDKMIPVFGVDATDAAKELIKSKKMVGTVKQDAEAMASALEFLTQNAGSGKAVMDGTSDYIVDDNVAKIRIPYVLFLGE